MPCEQPHQATVADALLAMGVETLPFLKGAEQKARRINRFLRAAEIDTLRVQRVPRAAPAQGRTTVYFDVQREPFALQRVIPKGLAQFRRSELASTTTKSDQLREVLALTPVAKVTRAQVQAFVHRLQADGLGPATVELERALLRKLFGYARRIWNWPGLPGVNYPELRSR
jgi:hypothetical protein